jgi:hypothetical protein
MAPAVASACFMSMSATTTVAPASASALAVAAPMPMPAPVTIAILSLSSMFKSPVLDTSSSRKPRERGYPGSFALIARDASHT